jgi:hypothetical protein
MYRPQFAYPLPPPPCEDQACMYSFDATNTPVLSGSLPAGFQTGRIPLRLDKNADFFALAVSTQGTALFRLEDGKSNPLSDSENASNVTNFENPAQYSESGGAGFVALESAPCGVWGAAGGNFLLYLYNPTAVSINLATVVINLIGRKRYPGPLCAD